jgi:hypothetical protein
MINKAEGNHKGYIYSAAILQGAAQYGTLVSETIITREHTKCDFSTYYSLPLPDM